MMRLSDIWKLHMYLVCSVLVRAVCVLYSTVRIALIVLIQYMKPNNHEPLFAYAFSCKAQRAKEKLSKVYNL